MGALIWFGVLAVYVVGLFPAAVRLTREAARQGRMTCPLGNSRGFCNQYHGPDCRKRHGDPEMADLLRVSWLVALWPIGLAALAAVKQAGKVPPETADLQRQIDDLEAQLGMDR